MARKKSKKRGDVKKTGIWIILMAMFIGELLIYTWCRVNYIDVGYEISKETRKQHELIALNNNLKIELASLKSPDRIAKIAKERFDLNVPTKRQTITIP